MTKQKVSQKPNTGITILYNFNSNSFYTILIQTYLPNLFLYHLIRITATGYQE